MLMVMVQPMLVACGSSDDDDNSLPFTMYLIADANGYWDIKEVTGNLSHHSKGAVARFYSNGTCSGFHYMETSWKIKDGKVYTYYDKTMEPMFVYTLLSRYLDKTHDELTVKVNGTLDDHSTGTIVMRRNAGAASAK